MYYIANRKFLLFSVTTPTQERLYQNGDRYSGVFVDDKANGSGIYQYINGDKYIGNFQDGMRNGTGVLTNKDGGVIYEGKWIKNQTFDDLLRITNERIKSISKRLNK